jgi:hypothetical protein
MGNCMSCCDEKIKKDKSNLNENNLNKSNLEKNEPTFTGSPKRRTKVEMNYLRNHPELHPNQRIPLPISWKSKVWKNIYGEEKVGKCKICEIEIRDNANWDMSHIIAAVNGGVDTLENLRPICHHCNISMGKKSVQQYVLEKFPHIAIEICKSLKIELK